MSSEAPTDSLFSWLDAAGNLNTLDVDVVRATSDKREAKLTDHVVETGAVVTDHIVIQPEQLSLEMVVTQTPLIAPGFIPTKSTLDVGGRTLTSTPHDINVRLSQFKPGGFLFLSSGITNAITDLFGAGQAAPTRFQGSESQPTTSSVQVTTTQTSTPVDRVNEAHDALIDIMNTGLLVTVSFKGRLYVDYLLRSVELSQGPNESGMGRFKVELRAFRFVTATTVSLPDPADFRALPKVQKGNKPTKTPDPDPTKTAKSFAKRGKDSGVDVTKNAIKALGTVLGG